jgi:5-formyltetrahydrofolate cyclo-ligase
MDVDIQQAKAALRIKILAALKNLPPEKRQSDAEKLRRKLAEQPVFQAASSILFFAPLPDELDLWPVLEETLAAGKVVALPCFDAENQFYRPRRVTDLQVELVSGRFGIREPSANCVEMPLDDLDLVLVPGVAFDLRGHRLGRGKGFYDRLLANFMGKSIGIAFDEQIVDAIPAEPQDVEMDFILTPTQCVRCDT